MLDPGWAALLGALVGGGATLTGTVLTGMMSSRTAKKAHDDLVAATALLMQDDFYHAQVTLARALFRCDWWTEDEQLPQQTTVDDRKTVWAALPNSPLQPDGWAQSAVESLAYLKRQSVEFRSSTPDSVTNAVADAQGWMDVLTKRRTVVAGRSPTCPDFETMKWTLALLDVSRSSLETLSHRPGTDFSQSRVVVANEDCDNVGDLLERVCPCEEVSEHH